MSDVPYTIQINNADLFLDKQHILRGITWKVERGEHWFVLGSNGAGKTTLVKMLMGFVWPRFGAEVTILGETYGKCDLSRLRKRIAWVSPFLQGWMGKRWDAIQVVLSGIDGTVGLYRMPSKEEAAKAYDIMEQLGCLDVAEHPFDTLSSGEQMKMLIARALISAPELLILDEACVHLDMKSREYLLETIDALVAGREHPTVIFITQRVEDITPVFTRGMILRKGKVVKSGNRADILTEANMFEAFDMHVKLTEGAGGRFWPSVIS